MAEELESAVIPDPDKERDAPKSKRITKKDWVKVERFLTDELESRQKSEFRQEHERKWREVDRQIAMNPMIKMDRNGAEIDQGWHNVIELGELSKSSENISADVRRILFPPSRFWFEPHSDITDRFPLDEQTGQRVIDGEVQEQFDGRLRSFMVQQHEDFGLKDACELFIKEALHHGSGVFEVDWKEQEQIFSGSKIKTKGAGVPIPHSMWNCYPDPSPSVMGTQMFYDGSMFIVRYQKRHKCEQLINSGEDGWMPAQWKKVPKDEHRVNDGKNVIKDVEVATYWGDICIERDDESLYYPNHKAILFNKKIVFMAPNATPFPPIIYRGYERMDVRDPYYTSPIIKQSPMQKLGTMLANKTMDGIELALEPPIVYDGNDPDFVLNGGPTIAPGSKTSTKGSNSFSQVQIGDVGIALTGLQFVLNEMKEKLGRPGRPVGDRATKAEVVKNSQDQEVSLVDFIGKMELAMRSYLYMQHALNLTKLASYGYYSPEAEDPDFLIMTRKELPKEINFEVVGSRGVLGEQERNERMKTTTAFLSSNPLFAPLLAPKEIAMEMYSDDGIKNAERLFKREGKQDPAVMAQELEQAKAVIQQLGQKLQQAESGNQAKMAKIEADHQAKTQKMAMDSQAKQQKTAADYQSKADKIQADALANMRKLAADQAQWAKELKDTNQMKILELLLTKQEESKAAKDEETSVKTSVDGIAKQIAQLEKAHAKLEETVKKPRKKKISGAKKVNGVWMADVSEELQ